MDSCCVCGCEAANKDANNEELRWCSRQSDHKAYMCVTCVARYVTTIISSDFAGVCSPMICPLCPKEEGKGGKRKTKTLDYIVWKLLVSEDKVKFHNTLASSLLLFLCGGCHAQRSLMVDTSQTQRPHAMEFLKAKLIELASSSTLSSSKTEEAESEPFFAAIALFEEGIMSVDEYYTLLSEQFLPKLFLTSASDDQQVFETFKHILRLVADPERRANLHLRHLRSRPRVWTSCCSREHCFKCRTKDSHQGRTCQSVTLQLDSSIVDCPSCGILLTRGDGCNRFVQSSYIEDLTHLLTNSTTN